MLMFSHFENHLFIRNNNGVIGVTLPMFPRKRNLLPHIDSYSDDQMEEKWNLKIRIPDFYDHLLEGYYIKEIVRIILDKSGYMVFPYGYESAFSYIKIQLHKGEVSDTPAAQRIRSSPDLLVYDSDERDIKLVEVKSRNFDDETSVAIDKVEWYQKYWEDSILTVVVPHGHWFYAEYVNKIKIKKPEEDYNLVKEFEKFEKIFSKVDVDTLYRFKFDIAKKMNRPRDSPHYFPEKVKGYNEQLLTFIRDHPAKSFDGLFDDYNSVNLASRKMFSKNLEVLIKEGKIKEVKNKFYPS